MGVVLAQLPAGESRGVCQIRRVAAGWMARIPRPGSPRQPAARTPRRGEPARISRRDLESTATPGGDGSRSPFAPRDAREVIKGVSKGRPPRRLVRSVAWSPDWKMVASGSFDKSVIVWDVETGEALKTLTGHRNAVHCVAWSPAAGDDRPEVQGIAESADPECACMQKGDVLDG